MNLTAHGVKTGEFVELNGVDALELERDRHFDPTADEEAMRSQGRMAAFF